MMAKFGRHQRIACEKHHCPVHGQMQWCQNISNYIKLYTSVEDKFISKLPSHFGYWTSLLSTLAPTGYNILATHVWLRHISFAFGYRITWAPQGYRPGPYFSHACLLKCSSYYRGKTWQLKIESPCFSVLALLLFLRDLVNKLQCLWQTRTGPDRGSPASASLGSGHPTRPRRRQKKHVSIAKNTCVVCFWLFVLFCAFQSPKQAPKTNHGTIKCSLQTLDLQKCPTHLFDAPWGSMDWGVRV